MIQLESFTKRSLAPLIGRWSKRRSNNNSKRSFGHKRSPKPPHRPTRFTPLFLNINGNRESTDAGIPFNAPPSLITTCHKPAGKLAIKWCNAPAPAPNGLPRNGSSMFHDNSSAWSGNKKSTIDLLVASHQIQVKSRAARIPAAQISITRLPRD